MSENRNILIIISITLALVVVYTTSLYSYLLFHGIAEMFSIVISFAIFMFAWNSKRFQDNDYFLFLGITYFFIGMLDFLHTLSYQGMNIFTDYDYYANQLWIGTRYLESISLVIAFSFLRTKNKDFAFKAFVPYAVVFTILVLSIFYWKVFPVCFIEGQGLTTFKVVSEYIICAILFSGLGMLIKNRRFFEDHIFRFIVYSFIFTIISELAFTFYVSNYGISNLIGHYFKIFSFYMIYRAIIYTGLVKPFNLLFKDLQHKQAELIKYADDLKELNANKDKFLSIISHDLRNPLTSIYGFADLLAKKADVFPREKIQEFSNDIYRSSKKLYGLLENLLQWALIQQDKVRFSPEKFPLKNLIDSNITLLAGNAKKKEINLSADIPENIQVFADFNMINSVMQNLITNAVKFTDRGGMVSVAAEQHSNMVEISVKDSGVGIDESVLNGLFSIESNVSTKGTSGEAGTGLGLILCKELVNKSGGEIKVESGPGKGSVFKFTLPSDRQGPAQ